jgi:hypothetical protein
VGKSSTTTAGVDNVTAGRQHEVFAAGQALAKQQLAPVDPSIAAAQHQYGQTVQAGNLGMSALSGNADAVQQLTDPYQQQVIDATTAQFGKTADQVQNNVAARAAAAGAFGGSRAAVTQGVAVGNAAIQQNQMIAQLRSQGYSDAQARAQVLAQMGQAATGASANLGMYQTQQAQAAQSHNFDTLAAARQAAGDHGTTQTKPGNLLGDVEGIANTVSNFFPTPKAKTG